MSLHFVTKPDHDWKAQPGFPCGCRHGFYLCPAALSLCKAMLAECEIAEATGFWGACQRAMARLEAHYEGQMETPDPDADAAEL